MVAGCTFKNWKFAAIVACRICKYIIRTCIISKWHSVGRQPGGGLCGKSSRQACPASPVLDRSLKRNIYDIIIRYIQTFLTHTPFDQSMDPSIDRVKAISQIAYSPCSPKVLARDCAARQIFLPQRLVLDRVRGMPIIVVSSSVTFMDFREMWFRGSGILFSPSCCDLTKSTNPCSPHLRAHTFPCGLAEHRRL